MLGQVLVLGLGSLLRGNPGSRWAAQRGTTGRLLPAGVVAHRLHVALPADVDPVELVEQREHARRVDAAGRCVRLAVGRRGAGGDVFVDRAVHLALGIRRLARHRREVVVLAEVPRPVVLAQEGTLGGEGLPQVAVPVEPGERRLVGLVLENDQPHVLDGRGAVAIDRGGIDGALGGRLARRGDGVAPRHRPRRAGPWQGLPAPHAAVRSAQRIEALRAA